MANGHETVEVSFDDYEVDVDVDMAPLVEELWEAEILVTNSCQELWPGIAWIEFPAPIAAMAFMSIIHGPHDDPSSLQSRMCFAQNRDTGPEEGAWRNRTYVGDNSSEAYQLRNGDVEITPVGVPDYDIFVSISFPRSDLPVVLEKVRAFNEHQRRKSETDITSDDSSPDCPAMTENTG